MRIPIKGKLASITLASMLALGGSLAIIPTSAWAITELSPQYGGECSGPSSTCSCTFSHNSYVGCDADHSNTGCSYYKFYNCTITGGGSGSGGGTTTPTSKYYYLKVYANGGTIPSNGPTNRTWSSTSTGSSFSYTIPAGIPTRDGYIFKGWHYQSGSSQPTGALTANKQPGDSISVTYSDASLTAVWEPVPTDTTKPTISGAADTSITVGDSFDPKAGVTASDDTDGDLTSNIKVTGTVDTSKPGTYELTYSVQDAAGNKSEVKRVVTVNPVMSASMPETGMGGGLRSR